MAPKVGCQERVRGLENAQYRRLESPRRRTGVLLPIYQTVSLETVWKVPVWVEWRVLWQREAPNRVPFRTVVQAKGTTKWSPFGLSRQSLEGLFSEVRMQHPA